VHSVEQSLVLPAEAADVWARAVTEDGINDELRPVPLERSRTLSFAIWQHERIVEPDGDDGCRARVADQRS
jgi:hypothetical protein